MSTQWNTKALGKPDALNGAGGGLFDESVVILMQGKNTFGDRIYSYVKLTLADLKRMQGAIQAGNPFNPSDFGSVVAAGKGEPTDEIRAEIASAYKILDGRGAGGFEAAPPPEPKAWDEY